MLTRFVPTQVFLLDRTRKTPMRWIDNINPCHGLGFTSLVEALGFTSLVEAGCLANNRQDWCKSAARQLSPRLSVKGGQL